MQLANVSNLSEVRLAIPAGRRVSPPRSSVRRANDRIGVREEDIDVGKRVWDDFGQGGLLGAEVSTRVGAQLVAQTFTPSGEKLGELVTGERLGGLEEFITETRFRKPVSNSRSAARETSRVIITTREKSDENYSTASELDRGVCEDVSRSIDSRMVAVYTTICIFSGVLIVSSEIDAWAIWK